MKLEELMENIKVFVEPLPTSGCYIAKVIGVTPQHESVHFELELSGCYTQQILEDTVSAQLEEIFSCQYHYEFDEVDEEDLHYDGGTFK